MMVSYVYKMLRYKYVMKRVRDPKYRKQLMSMDMTPLNQQLFRFILEAYMDIFISGSLQIHSYRTSDNPLIENVNTKGKIYNIVLAIICMTAIGIHFVYSLRKIWVYTDERLSDPAIEIVCEDLKKDPTRKLGMMYHILFVFRRATIVILIINAQDLVIFAMIAQLYLSIFILCVLASLKPFEISQKNKNEMFNEFTIYLA